MENADHLESRKSPYTFQVIIVEANGQTESRRAWDILEGCEEETSCCSLVAPNASRNGKIGKTREAWLIQRLPPKLQKDFLKMQQPFSSLFPAHPT